ncbi:MAG: hypothetical protein GX616_15110, partial [Planctomycetes bacterium]|nr:hypothetical protein [Planctomycetota bacterium]
MNLYVAIIINVAAAVPAEDDHNNRCGASALQECLQAVGAEHAALGVDELLPADGLELSLLALKHAARTLGFHAEGYRWERPSPPSFTRGRTSAIVPLLLAGNRRHYIAILESREESALCVDFPMAPQWIDYQTLRSVYQWDGTMLYISRTQANTAQALHRFGGELIQVSVGGTFLFSLASLTAVLMIFGRPQGSRARLTSRQGFTLVETLVAL